MGMKTTVYPSVDKPWLKYYKENAEAEANAIPQDKTVWDIIEEKLLQYKEIPAIEYFGRNISRPEFVEMVYGWARAFKALGVGEDEVVPYYGPFFPDIGAMAFALNMIGACPYFLKLAISPEALAEETSESKIAIVYDDMWANVSGEFLKDRFRTVIIASVTDAMPVPKKQIVSLLQKVQKKPKSSRVPRGGKFISFPDARKHAQNYSGEVKASFVPDRAAFITSSSGTTVDGVVKGCVATNESTIAQLYMGDASGTQFFSGTRCLDHFPPTASTALNILFFLPLYRGMTVVMDPRVSEEDFYRQVLTKHVHVVVNTGSAWEAFFTRLEKELAEGKEYDLSYVKAWVVGGEGTDIKRFEKWDAIIKKCGAKIGMASAYGSSELFSCICVEAVNARCSFTKPIMSVGIPYAGMVVGVFDSQGRELGYNQRGELWIKSNSSMKEYYLKPELSARTKVDGWVHSGDLAEIDEDGFVYIWGRVKDTVQLKNGEELYLFDVANRIKECDRIDDAIVLQMPTREGIRLAAHIVWEGDLTEEQKKQAIEGINDALRGYLPEEVILCGYAEHEIMLPYSPTTLKKDKNKMSKQTTGYRQVVDGRLIKVEFERNIDGTYTVNYHN